MVGTPLHSPLRTYGHHSLGAFCVMVRLPLLMLLEQHRKIILTTLSRIQIHLSPKDCRTFYKCGLKVRSIDLFQIFPIFLSYSWLVCSTSCWAAWSNNGIFSSLALSLPPSCLLLSTFLLWQWEIVLFNFTPNLLLPPVRAPTLGLMVFGQLFSRVGSCDLSA